MKKFVSFLAQIIFGLTFLIFGIFHLMNLQTMAEMVVPSYIPFPAIAVAFTGLALIAASISLFINKYVKLSMLLLTGFLVSMIVLVQIPGLHNPISQLQQMAMVSLLKDAGLAGGALYIAADNW